MAQASQSGKLLEQRGKVVLLFGALVFFCSLFASLSFGRLSMAPGYDDVWYLLDGGVCYEKLVNWGILPCAKMLFLEQNHSLFCTLQALASFLLFGLRDWAPYVLNVFQVLLFIWGCHRIISQVRGSLYWAGMALVFVLPITFYTAQQFRPDFLNAALCAIGATLVLRGLGRGDLCVKEFVGGLSLMLSALWVKSSFFPLTYILCGVVIGFVALGGRVGLVGLKPMKAMALGGSVLLVATLMFLPTSGLHAIEYFWTNSQTDTGRAIWAEFSFAEALAVYTIGGTGENLMGLARGVFLLGLLVACLHELYRKRWLSFTLTGCVVALLSLLVVAKSGADNGFFPMLFWMLTLFILLDRLNAAPTEPCQRGAIAGLLALFAFVVAVMRPGFCTTTPRGENINAEMVASLYAEGIQSGEEMRIFVPLIGEVNDYRIRWECLRQRKPLMAGSDISLESMAEFEQAIEGYNVVILPVDLEGGVVQNHLTYRIRNDIQDAFQRSADWQLFRTYSDGVNEQWRAYLRKGVNEAQ